SIMWPSVQSGYPEPSPRLARSRNGTIERFVTRATAAGVGGPALITIAAAGMLAWSWGRWPDPVLDFGRELYVPWQLADGKVLYEDIAYFNGPLSPYFNALWFRIFGASLRTLVYVNLAIVAWLLVVLYDLLARLGGRIAATVGGL